MYQEALGGQGEAWRWSQAWRTGLVGGQRE